MIENMDRTFTALSQASDADLVAESLRGDREAFGALVLRYRVLAIGVAYRICGNAVLAEDIAQEAFIRVWRKLATFRPDGSFKGWVCRITANLTIDALRRQKPLVDIDSVQSLASGQEPESAAIQSERARAVRAALMRLPVHSRAVLVLREFESLSYQEIADILDIPLGTVKSRLNDARRRLQDELAGYLKSESEG